VTYKNATPATGESRGRAKLSKKRTGTTRDGNSVSPGKTNAAPSIGDRFEYECPFCRDDANATYKCTRYGDVDWFIGCWTRDCDGRRLPTLAVELGLSEGATKEQIGRFPPGEAGAAAERRDVRGIGPAAIHA
jgi:hypothetical protein